MSKFAFCIWLTMLAALILLSFSSLAMFGGLLVIVGLIVAYAMIARVLGDESNGQMVHGIVVVSSLAGAIFLAFIAAWRLYRAAGLAAQGDHQRSRREIAWGLSMLAAPVVIYNWYKAMPVI